MAYVNFSGNARDTMAQLYRNQWEDYISRFGGAEKELVGSYRNQGLMTNRLNEARKFANLGSDSGEAAQGLLQSRYQARYTPQETAAQRRSNLLDRTLARVDLANRTRSHMVDRDRAILDGGLTNSGKQKLTQGGY